eukprot:5628094-Prorocentrum_lima.AAC.1
MNCLSRFSSLCVGSTPPPARHGRGRSWMEASAVLQPERAQPREDCPWCFLNLQPPSARIWRLAGASTFSECLQRRCNDS